MQRYVCLAAWIVLASACGEGGDAGLAQGANRAEASESFSALYEEVFVARGCTSCHGDQAPGALDMSTPEKAYAQMVGVSAAGRACTGTSALRVEPGDAEHSLLWQKLEGHDAQGGAVCGQRMPQKEALSDEDVERVRSWIADGAPDN